MGAAEAEATAAKAAPVSSPNRNRMQLGLRQRRRCRRRRRLWSSSGGRAKTYPPSVRPAGEIESGRPSVRLLVRSAGQIVVVVLIIAENEKREETAFSNETTGEDEERLPSSSTTYNGYGAEGQTALSRPRPSVRPSEEGKVNIFQKCLPGALARRAA